MAKTVNFEERFDKWYWSYGYASKAICIKAVEQSDLTPEEKKIRINYHKGNMGVTKNFPE